MSADADRPRRKPIVGESQTDTRPTENRVSSKTLFGNAKILFIEHNGSTYTLRETRTGKLILTK